MGFMSFIRVVSIIWRPKAHAQQEGFKESPAHGECQQQQKQVSLSLTQPSAACFKLNI